MYILLPSWQWIFELHHTAGIHKSSHPMGSFTAQFNRRGLSIPGCQTCGEAPALHHTGQTATDFSFFLQLFFPVPRNPADKPLAKCIFWTEALAHITVRDFKHIPMPRQCLSTPANTQKREKGK